MVASRVICALGKQFDLVSVRITDINGKAVILLHRFFWKPVRNQSIARLVCCFRWDKQCKVLAAAWPIMSKQRQTLRFYFVTCTSRSKNGVDLEDVARSQPNSSSFLPA